MPSSTHSQPLPAQTWLARAQEHLQHIQTFTQPARERRSRGEKHPVLDFLNTYYSLPLGRLEKWHPSPEILLERPSKIPAHFTDKHYHFSHDHLCLDLTKITSKEKQRLTRIHNLLTLTQHRSAQYACHGLHEWAMVYKGQPQDIRHRQSAPLRLPQEDIDQLVETHPLLCTHFDAYRHFTPTAQPLNRHQPTLETREHNEQPGCIHANMDLYKWAYKAMPWIGSDLLRETFHLALEAREIDMRAAPYDLSAYHLSPIKIESPEGQKNYEEQQRQLHKKAQPLRQTLIESLQSILGRNT